MERWSGVRTHVYNTAATVAAATTSALGPRTGRPGEAASRDGHQIFGAMLWHSAGPKVDRTTTVSSSTPSATVKATSTRNTRGRSTSTAKVAARTTPAEVMTPPVT